MKIKTSEIKARCTAEEQEKMEEFLRGYCNPPMMNWKIDYNDFCLGVISGRTKIREEIFNNEKRLALISYMRGNQDGPKFSRIEREDITGREGLVEVLKNSIGVWQIVKNHRHIFTAGIDRIHLDNVEELGRFMEIEIVDTTGRIEEGILKQHCYDWMERLGVKNRALISGSYAELLYEQQNP